MIFSVCKTSSCFPVSLSLLSSIGIELIFMPSVVFCLSLHQYKQHAWMNSPSWGFSKADFPHQSFLSPIKRSLSCEEVFFSVSFSFTTILFSCMKKEPLYFGCKPFNYINPFYLLIEPNQSRWVEGVKFSPQMSWPAGSSPPLFTALRSWEVCSIDLSHCMQSECQGLRSYTGLLVHQKIPVFKYSSGQNGHH